MGNALNFMHTSGINADVTIALHRHPVGELEVAKGDTVLVPHAAGAVDVTGDVTAIRCRPPAPDAEEGAW